MKALALIKVGYACNEHCTFCHTQDVRPIQGERGEIEAKIARAKSLGHTMVVFSGGEPTIRPELFEWAEQVAALDMDVGLVTNGLVLAYEDVVARLLATRLRYVYLSLHGGEARVHDAIVRTDAFAAARQALANVAGKVELTINCVVTRQNLAHLRALVDLGLDHTGAVIKLSAVEPKGGAWHLRDVVVPRISEAAAAVADAIEYGRARDGSTARLRHGGFPLCLLPGLEHLYDDLRTHGYRTMVEVGEPDFFPVDDENMLTPPETCDDCALRGPCPGLFTGYHAKHGAGELRPVLAGARGNSFDWVLETVVEHTGVACPLREDGVTPWDRGRHLFVRHAGKIGRYRADTRDFADREIVRIKHALGQVYLDATRKLAPDDFAHDLVQLSRSGLCDDCPEHGRCTGMFEPTFVDPFTRDEARVHEILGELEGDVLDIGCGHAPYVAALAEAATSGRVRYVGCDPDESALARLRARHPWARLHHTDATHAAELGTFDHALVLRSWNHWPDADAALAALASALRPGGSLLVVDDVAFGLARTPGQTARARSGGASFEHHRNDDAHAAHARIAAAGFELLERRDVGPRTSCAWLLRYRKPGSVTVT